MGNKQNILNNSIKTDKFNSKNMQRLLSLLIITRVSAIWKSSNISLFGGDDGIATGLYNDTIYLLGGYVNRNQIKIYEYKTGTLLNIGSNVLSVDVWGFSQYWTQINHTLYLIIPPFDSTPNHIATYNLATNIFTPDFKSIPINVEHYACLTYNDPYLYIIGGENDQWGTLNSVQTLDLNTMQWIYNVPYFNTQRISFSCIVYHNYIWIFGGIQTATNERVAITNIETNSWHYVEPLTLAAFGTRCVAFYDVIYIIGGRYKLDSNTEHLDIVHIMDVETGTITVSADKMPYATAFTSPIIADGVLYAFGGTRDVYNNVVGNWMYYNLSTLSPTTKPTLQPPTKSPTSLPTANPTVDPTSSPTYHPSNIATNNAVVSLFTSLATLSPTISTSITNTNTGSISDRKPEVIIYVLIVLTFVSFSVICFSLSYFVRLWRNSKKNNMELKPVNSEQKPNILHPRMQECIKSDSYTNEVELQCSGILNDNDGAVAIEGQKPQGDTRAEGQSINNGTQANGVLNVQAIMCGSVKMTKGGHATK